MTESATWGHVSIRDDPGPPLVRTKRPQEDMASKRYVWQPYKVLEEHLLANSGVVLHCQAAPDGERRFSPIGRGDRSLDPFLPFYTSAFLCGFAIICHAKKLTKQERHSYRVMWFLFQRVQKMRQHIRLAFNTKKDLTIAVTGRLTKDVNDSHVLPWPFDSTTRSRGYPQSVDELIERGEKAAKGAEIRCPSVSQKIHYGLAEVARLDPQSLRPDDAVRVIQYVLFDVDPGWDKVDPETRKIVIERVLDAIEPHLDDTSAVFNDWFWGRHNTFVKQIAQQKKSRGGELDPEIVQQVLLQLGWESHEYVGQCVHAWAHDMQKALPEPLTKTERQAFEGIFFCRPDLGGIPLVMLAGKLQFVHTVLEDIFKNPGEKGPVQTLYRLLQLYAIMVSNRRKANVRIKEVDKRTRKRLKREPGQTLCMDTVPEQPDSSDSQSRVEQADLLRAIYQSVAKSKRVTCKCSQPKWDVKLEALKKGNFRLVFCCHECRVRRERTLSTDELKSIEARLK